MCVCVCARVRAAAPAAAGFVDVAANAFGCVVWPAVVLDVQRSIWETADRHHPELLGQPVGTPPNVRTVCVKV